MVTKCEGYRLENVIKLPISHELHDHSISEMCIIITDIIGILDIFDNRVCHGIFGR